VVDQEQQMNELGMTSSQIVFVLVVMSLAFIVGYSIGFNSGKDEGYRSGYSRGRNFARRNDK
jgi:hypothetical protein